MLETENFTFKFDPKQEYNYCNSMNRLSGSICPADDQALVKLTVVTQSTKV